MTTLQTPNQDMTGLNSNTWAAAISMMLELYQYSSGLLEDPSSYSQSNDTAANTGYQFHDQNTCNVFWHDLTEADVIVPGVKVVTSDSGKGEDATITTAELANVTTPQCFTDCSGWVTSALAFSNLTGGDPAFPCESGDVAPFAGDFYIDVTSENNFSNISLDNITPGDFVVAKYSDGQDDTGHIMIVVAVGDENADGVTEITVVDQANVDGKSTFGHDNDTRVNGDRYMAGLGMGIIGLKALKSEESGYYFFWKASDAKPIAQAAVIGRANVA